MPPTTPRQPAWATAKRPVGDTARDAVATQDVTPLVDGVGLDRRREEELLRAWHGRERRAER